METSENIKKTYDLSVEGNIVFITLFKKMENKEDEVFQAESVASDILNVFKDNPEKVFHAVADLSPIGTGPYIMAREARKAYKNLLSGKQVGKMAVVTQSGVMKTVITFVLSAAGKGGNMKFFSSKEDAASWLKNEQ